MITRKVCIGAPQKCFYVREFGKGLRNVAFVYTDLCVDMAIQNLGKELKSSSKVHVKAVFVPETLVPIELFDHLAPDPEGCWLEKVLHEVVQNLGEPELAIRIRCARDSVPHLLTIDKEGHSYYDNVVVVNAKDLSKLINIVKSRVRGELMINCGAEFSKKELDTLMKELKRIAVGDVSKRPSLYVGHVVRANAFGLFIPYKSVGEEVVEGDVLGVVNDEEIASPCNGKLMFISWGKVVKPSEIVAIIAKKP